MAVAYTAVSAASVNYVLYIPSYSAYNFNLQILSWESVYSCKFCLHRPQFAGSLL